MTDDRLCEMLRTLSDEEYEAVPVPSSEEIRSAFRRCAEVLRRAASQPKRHGVDPRLRFR